MRLDHIELKDLKTTNLNVRKRGAKNVDDILPSIRSLGVLQPLLVRPNCEAFEIVAGQRRYYAATKLAEEAIETGGTVDPLPCIIMEDGDDAKAIEASLAENIARLPMDEIDQYKAFSALVKQGRSVEDVAAHFGVTERLVKQRLAIANLYQPILTAYRKDDIGADTIRALTLATKRQQKAWWQLFISEDDYAPRGRALKAWLFGGADIPVANALFDVDGYGGNIISDLFGKERYFDDAIQFWALQNTAVAEARDRYLDDGWSEVVLFEVGEHWSSWEYSKITKSKGGKVYVTIAHDGEVTFHEGYLTSKEAAKREKARVDGGEAEVEPTPSRPELTKAMQNYLDLHRHAVVREKLLSQTDIALRVGLAQMIAGSSLWDIRAEKQKANTEAIQESVASNKAETRFAEERWEIVELLGLKLDDALTLVPTQRSWADGLCPYAIFAKLREFDNETVMRIYTFVVAETLPSGDALVEGLGGLLSVDMAENWSPEEAFFDLLRDKEAINACVKEAAGKATADAHVSSTAKVQKKIIRDCLDGTRSNGNNDWHPRYMTVPMKGYTKRGGIEAIERFSVVKKHFA
ncbi:ParB/RepB/Spo0J family partition protein [Pseudahrensia aquimaris]|uniref:ParB/RepB/Spo0J family partition protein n=1 Tax=Pseudahrensia aquimaris TaxID=744461 RepID=A0ABW3FHM4_9HYPH